MSGGGSAAAASFLSFTFPLKSSHNCFFMESSSSFFFSALILAAFSLPRCKASKRFCDIGFFTGDSTLLLLLSLHQQYRECIANQH
jgi:hypothetical protein